VPEVRAIRARHYSLCSAVVGCNDSGWFVDKPEVIVGGAFAWRFCTQSLLLIRLNGRITKTAQARKTEQQSAPKMGLDRR
jgi:hypothetical protein